MNKAATILKTLKVRIKDKHAPLLRQWRSEGKGAERAWDDRGGDATRAAGSSGVRLAVTEAVAALTGLPADRITVVQWDS